MRNCLALLLLCLGACASAPPVPAWQVELRDTLERAQTQLLVGGLSTQGKPLADVDMGRARKLASASGQPALLARVELALCAAQAAALDPQGSNCPGLARWSADMEPQSAAYHRYLRGQHAAADVPLLPEVHRAVAQAILSGSVSGPQVVAMADPLAQLVAVQAALQAKAASPDAIAAASETSSAQGWRKARMAWLSAQLKLAQAQGNPGDVQKFERALASMAP